MKKIKKTSQSTLSGKKFLVPHYVCTGGCKQVSENPGKCTTQGCFRYRNPLTLCDCKNGKHGHLFTLNVPKD